MSSAATAHHVIRLVQRRTYKTIPLRAVEDDERLTWKAVGIHTYLITRPEGWRFYRSDLVGRHRDGVDAVKSGLRELRECGYLRMIANGNGGYVWLVSEAPLAKSDWEAVASGGKTPAENPPTPGGKSADPPGGKSADVTISNSEQLEGKQDMSGEQVGLFGGDEPDSVQPAPKPKRRHPTQRDYSEAFEELWALQPRGSKWQAFDEYEAVLETGAATHERLAKQLRAYVASLRNGHLGAHLVNWLKQGRWEEDPGPAAPTEDGYDWEKDLDRLGAGA